jgi:putative transposase
LRKKTPKRKVSAKRREDRVVAAAANDCWSMDFLSDQLFDGRKIRVLTIVDNFTRVSPAIDVRFSYRGTDVVATLERIAATYGRPKRIRVDNGPEFISKELDLWAWLHGVELDFSRPGKPTDNAFAESFNGKFRAECLNTYCPQPERRQAEV